MLAIVENRLCVSNRVKANYRETIETILNGARDNCYAFFSVFQG